MQVSGDFRPLLGIYVTGLETPSSAEITLIDQADVWMGPGGCEGADGCGCKCPVDGPAEGQVTANLGEVGSAGARGTDTGRLVMRQEATASDRVTLNGAS